ncbi:MAG: hypothetical protein AABZ33_10435 [Chloroflexota bacterium]
MRRLPIAVMTIALLAGACRLDAGGTVPPSETATTGPAGSIPSCDQVEQISAAADAYRDSPIYVGNEMPTDEVRAWAAGKPGFEEIWIDREHLGWITLAFSVDADARQAELAEAFPDVGVVAVGVDWTMAEFEALQARVMTELSPLFPVKLGNPPQLRRGRDRRRRAQARSGRGRRDPLRRRARVHRGGGSGRRAGGRTTGVGR